MGGLENDSKCNKNVLGGKFLLISGKLISGVGGGGTSVRHLRVLSQDKKIQNVSCVYRNFL